MLDNNCNTPAFSQPGVESKPFFQDMKMKLKNIIIIALMLVLSQSAYAFNLNDIAAYPVPFNPHKTKLNVDKPGATLGPHKVIFAVYDINGDLVIKKNLSTFPVMWNGRNNSGRLVKPGLYIIKVEVDDDSTGDYGKKIIRILVDY
jgi:hypothetical protein